MKKIKYIIGGIFLLVMFLSPKVFAASKHDVVINELMWTGSFVSSADEWIELKNTSDENIDLSGWKLTRLKDGNELEMVSISSGEISANGYFLISNKDENHQYAGGESILAVAPDYIDSGISLSGSAQKFSIVGNIIIDAISNGIVAGNGVQKGTITGNTIIGTSAAAGINCYGYHATYGYTRNITISSNAIYGVQTGIYLTTKAQTITILGNVIDSIQRGIDISANCERIIANENIIENSTDIAIHLSASNVIVANNHIYTATNYGIALESGADNCLISGNYITGCKQGILALTGSTGNLIISNRAYGNTTADINIIESDNTIKHNLGYVTENSGTETFSGDGSTTTFSFAHGLAGTPTHVEISATSADTRAAMPYSWSADATNVTITFATAPASGTDNVTFSWKAEM